MVGPVARQLGVPWWPEALHSVAKQARLLRGFRYIVVEEVVDHRVVLMSWPWPRADRKGRLFWSVENDVPTTTTVDQDLLWYQLYRPSRLKRQPRPGDVFASAGADRGWDGPAPVQDVRTLFQGPVFDVSADAREAAKLAYQGAVGTVQPPERADEADKILLSQAGRVRAQLKVKQLTVSPPPRAERSAGQQ